MERRIRIRIVAVALTAVFLASIALASLASAASSNAAGTGTYQTFALSKYYGYGTFKTITTSWRTIMSLSMPYVPISGWYYVVCDGYATFDGGSLEVAIGVNSATEDSATRRFYELGPTGFLRTGIHTERMYSLGAGAHTFYFLARGFTSIEDCYVNYMTITVTFFTDASVSRGSSVGEVGGSADTG